MLTETQQLEFMRECLVLCDQAAAQNEVPIAAMVIKDGRVIGKAFNRRSLDCDPSAHAEILAMRQAGKALGVWNLSGCDLVVTLEPCAMCAGAIVNARIGNVYFGAYDKRFGYCGTLGNIVTDSRLNHRANVQGGILEAECLKPIKDFFVVRRRNYSANPT